MTFQMYNSQTNIMYYTRNSYEQNVLHPSLTTSTIICVLKHILRDYTS